MKRARASSPPKQGRTPPPPPRTPAAGWAQIEAEAREAFAAGASFPLPAYSEYMPPPYVGIKPYDPDRTRAPATAGAGEEGCLDITEYEQAQELDPGVARIAERVVAELGKLVSGKPHGLSRQVLADTPAWPANLAAAAERGALGQHPLAVALPLALSRTQDDKGNVRWTLFGGSHDGPSAAFWRSFGPEDGERFARVMAFLTDGRSERLDQVGLWEPPADAPAFLHDRILEDAGSLAGVRAILTFCPFARLPVRLQEAYLAGDVTLVPAPASLVFHEQPRYSALAKHLRFAQQIPLLTLFPRTTEGYVVRIPQSGWLDEYDACQGGPASTRHHVIRSHRWQRLGRDETAKGDGGYTHRVTVALFSTNPDDLGLYGKPLARNAQLWTTAFEPLLDGPTATRADLDRAAEATDEGGRFGYRFLFPAMRAGLRELYWHRPLLAKLDSQTGRASLLVEDGLLGYVTAEVVAQGSPEPRLELTPRILARRGHSEVAKLCFGAPGHARRTHGFNARKVLELSELLGEKLPPSFARRLLHVARETSLDQWFAELPEALGGKAIGAGNEAEDLARALRAAVGNAMDPGEPLTFNKTATRAFEEALFRSIASLAEGDLSQKDNADPIIVNAAKAAEATGGAPEPPQEQPGERDLERLGDELHARHQRTIASHGMEGKAEALDHVFRWETDFDFSWSDAWLKNQTGEFRERNIVVMIPGRRRDEAVIMADHYDTAYMEDVYEKARGGTGVRAAAAGADDNHSATSALLLAADVLLGLSREGRLERDVWLVHLTGEEFPSDCMGARALARALCEQKLVFTAGDGSPRDVSRVRVVGAFVLDMIGHNSDRDRDVFQIAPGEGSASARLALRAHRANERWNRSLIEWNRSGDRRGKGRARRMPDGKEPPPPFAHLPLAGEVRVEWEPRSSLYNTDGQIFSDLGIPVVLFMENYDIRRAGYHDTEDTMKNIDLDYASALAAIAIESVADVAMATTL